MIGLGTIRQVGFLDGDKVTVIKRTNSADELFISDKNRELDYNKEIGAIAHTTKSEPFHLAQTLRFVMYWHDKKIGVTTESRKWRIGVNSLGLVRIILFNTEDWIIRVASRLGGRVAGKKPPTTKEETFWAEQTQAARQSIDQLVSGRS